MEEQSELKALGLLGEWLWGDDMETTVFAQAFGNGQTFIFRFTRDQSCGSESLVTRIVNCFHDLADDDEKASFPDRASMRKAIWAAVATIWMQCSHEPGLQDPDAIIDIYDDLSDDNRRHLAWNICHENLFNDYLSLLLPVSQVAPQQHPDTVDFSTLIRHNQLGGRGSTTLVQIASNPESRLVYKGIDFRTFLHTYEDGHIQEEVKIFYRSLKLVSNMPRHPNIMKPPLALVTIRRPTDNTQLVCGSLYPLLPNGTLEDQIRKFNLCGQRISLANKANWCYQMVAAIAHTHFVAHTYHMDIKPGNFLLGKDLSLILIDWEQCDAPISTVAPEVDGSFDVRHETDNLGAKLVYTKYTGPERRNMPESTPGQKGWNAWNVFPIWNVQCPKALELAEVFSVGRSMWMLLRQLDLDAFEDLTSTDDVVEDWSSCEDLPELWKRNVECCLKRDPNERIGLQELLKFWDDARHAY